MIEERGHMTYEEAREVVDRISHPFMLFTLEKCIPFDNSSASYNRMVTLRIVHKCADSKTLEPIILNRARKMVLMHATEKSLVDEVWRCVQNAALHEAGEYFKYKGVAIHDPHDRVSV